MHYFALIVAPSTTSFLFRLAEVFWDDLKHARRIYQKRAVLEDDGHGNFSVRNLSSGFRSNEGDHAGDDSSDNAQDSSDNAA